MPAACINSLKLQSALWWPMHYALILVVEISCTNNMNILAGSDQEFGSSVFWRIIIIMIMHKVLLVALLLLIISIFLHHVILNWCLMF